MGRKQFYQYLKDNKAVPDDFKISKKEGVKFLLRLRIEPGDDGKLKFCPTFQATISNINKAHGGKLPLFHEEVFSRKKNALIRAFFYAIEI